MEELSQHGEWLVDRFIEALEKGGHVVSSDLIDSIDYMTGSEGGAQTLTVSLPTYGRAMEVMARKRRQQQGWTKKNGEVWEIRANVSRRRNGTTRTAMPANIA